MNGQIPEWPKGTDCKSAATCFGGSNPPPPILKLNSDDSLINLNAQIAQLVEQWTENPCVAGSIPALGIFNLQNK